MRDLIEQVERRKIAQTEQMGDERSRLLRQQIGANARPAPTTATNVDRLSCGFTLADLGFFRRCDFGNCLQCCDAGNF